MKKIYLLSFLFCAFIFYSCSKDILKSYDKRIVGTWRISDVNRVGIGGNTSDLPFTSGTFTFYTNGSLDYRNSANISFKGSWDIVKKTRDKETVQSLQVTAVDFTNQQVHTQYYDDMTFVSTNHFKTTINSTLHNYMTHFRR